ncbi:uncharacterized protein SPSK_08587 [Sporothrix schenckii 1099-18]|uniref:Uncharacterized protein n=1 Tax=Sporothrix schenckii 1099-18 TaxID=1397361 RepID=A0A0F2M6U4_SPOSC|nr:uncharacterized protein SPSK_08587 [Sporothrix schenckii 1099-18]KJR84804.1 hypothetical protein SPSK_08587 [Sporothrix schenckii 1099-18]
MSTLLLSHPARRLPSLVVFLSARALSSPVHTRLHRHLPPQTIAATVALAETILHDARNARPQLAQSIVVAAALGDANAQVGHAQPVMDLPELRLLHTGDLRSRGDLVEDRGHGGRVLLEGDRRGRRRRGEGRRRWRRRRRRRQHRRGLQGRGWPSGHCSSALFARVGHEQHEPLRDGQTRAQQQHGRSNGGAQQPVEPGLHGDKHERQDQQDQRHGHGQKVEGVGHQGRQTQARQERRGRGRPRDKRRDNAGLAGQARDGGDAVQQQQGAADAGVVAEAVGADKGAGKGGEGGDVDGARVDVAGVVVAAVAANVHVVGGRGRGRLVRVDVGGMCVGSMCVGASRGRRRGGLETVFEVVAQQVKAAKDQENAHSKPGQDLGAAQAKWVADGGAPPDLKIAEHIDGNTDGRGADVEEHQVREGCQGQAIAALGSTQKHKDSNGSVTQAPVETDALVAVHACPGLTHGRDGEGGRQDRRRARWWLLEDLVLSRDAAVFVSMATTKANVLARKSLNGFSAGAPPILMGAEFAGDDEEAVWSSMAPAGGRRKLLLPRSWRCESGLRRFAPSEDEKTAERGERGGPERRRVMRVKRLPGEVGVCLVDVEAEGVVGAGGGGSVAVELAQVKDAAAVAVGRWLEEDGRWPWTGRCGGRWGAGKGFAVDDGRGEGYGEGGRLRAGRHVPRGG